MIGQTVTRAVPDRVVPPDGAAGRNASRPPSLLPLVTFLGLCVLAMCGDTIRFAYLPIYMELQLGTPDWLRGVVISVQSVGMLVFIPIMGVLADRFGAHRLVVVNVLLGVGANLGFMAADSELTLIAATVLNAAMWATLGGIGITVAQDLYPSGIGMASSLYFSAIRFSAAIGGIAGGLGVGWFGVPGVFLVPALLCIVAAVGLLIQAMSGSAPLTPSRASGRQPRAPSAPLLNDPANFEVTSIDDAALEQALEGSHGEAIFSPAAAQRLVQYFSAADMSPRDQAFPQLTDREREVLELIGQGHSNTALKSTTSATGAQQRDNPKSFALSSIRDGYPDRQKGSPGGFMSTRPRITMAV